MSDETLKIKEFVVNEVQLGDNYSFTHHKLIIPTQPPTKQPAEFQSVEVKVLPPHGLNVATNSIMDIVPISTKVLGQIGTGVTHTLTGVYLLLTGAEKNGKQIHDFGASDGTLQDKLMLDKDGTPGKDDYIIMFNVILDGDYMMDRKAINQVFEYADEYLQPIRKILKVTNGRYADYSHEFENEVHPGKPKVAIVKEVAGQGAMYDNLLLPNEPSGMQEGVSIIDINNFPVLLTPNEYRDGAIHALV